MTNFILVVFLVIAIAMFFYGLIRQFQAEQSNAPLPISRALMQKKKRQEADQQRARAEEQTAKTEKALEQLRDANIQIQSALNSAREQRNIAQAALKDAQDQKDIAQRETKNAKDASAQATKNYQIARQALEDNNKLLYLSIAQSMEAKSVTMDDKDLAGLWPCRDICSIHVTVAPVTIRMCSVVCIMP